MCKKCDKTCPDCGKKLVRDFNKPSGPEGDYVVIYFRCPDGHVTCRDETPVKKKG